MLFEKVEPDKDFDVVKFTSLEGEWNIGIRRVMYGFRISGNPIWYEWSKGRGTENRIKCQEYTFDYCAGADFSFVLQLLVTMMTIMESLPATVTVQEVKSMLPDWERRPINIEGEQCWPKLQELAASLLKEEMKVS